MLTRTAAGYVNRIDSGCELLSNHYLCANKNSDATISGAGESVVNCFQIIIFVLTRTAWGALSAATDEL